jgi:hypothetical protein
LLIAWAPSRAAVHRRREVRERVGGRLDQQGVAVGADRRDHVEVEGDLLGPADVGRGQRRRGAVLAHLAEAAIGRGAGRQAELRAVLGKVGLGVGVVERVDDGDRLAAAGGGGREPAIKRYLTYPSVQREDRYRLEASAGCQTPDVVGYGAASGGR